ncbi:MAG: hypothetical protein OER86_13250 [Phycisphaerae bacterium]|nr:hypothetical protein [Phycisphaerae bacterium]
MSTHACVSNPVVVLGASNVALNLRRILRLVSGQVSHPHHFLVASGHGRSYGTSSAVLFRHLPGIRHCGLWEALENTVGPTRALVTDIGNDILYGQSPQTILQWIGECMDRLAAREARIVITDLPLASIDRLSPAWFNLFCSMLFPARSITLGDAVARAHEVSRGLKQFAHLPHVTLVRQEFSWYGLDPIHIRPRWRERAWRHILDSWSNDPSQASLPRPSALHRWPACLHLLTPHRRRLFRVNQSRPQPCVHREDGSCLSLY